jgi:hypothetical protein
MSVIDEEKVKNLLDAILKAIKNDADPRLLNHYRALIRKNVSFFQRSYLAAYLLMLQEQPQGRQRRSGGGDYPRGRANGRNNPAISGGEANEGAETARQGQRTAQQSPAPVSLPEDESTRLFISIGRNRRVFPREILGLIFSKSSLAREDIGLITILNNYSFVQVRNSVAAELLEALNGVSFRGKTLTVNYARIRKEGDEDFPEEPALKPLEQDAPDIDGVGSDAIDEGAYVDTFDDADGDSLDPMDADDSGEAGEAGTDKAETDE